MRIKINNYKKFIKELDKNYSNFTPVQKRIADYLISNIDEVSYLTTDELASKLNTTPSSIVRFCKKIEYNGYPEMQRDLRKFVLEKINSFSPVEKAKKVPTTNFETIVTSSLLVDIENLKELLQSEYNIENKINYFIQELIQSKSTYIIANRASFGLAHTLWYYCKKTINDIYLLNDFNGAVFDYLRDIDRGCLIIAISFPNYSKATLNFCKYAKKKGVKIISITDRKDSPLCKYSSYRILTPINSLGYHTSRVAAEAMVNAIISKLFVRKKEITIKNLEIENDIKEQFF